MNVIITGASKGIGKAIANLFAWHGHNLYLCSKNEKNLFKTKEELTKEFPEVKIFAKAFDLSVDAKAFANWILDLNFDVDIIVNNAGIFEPGNIFNQSDNTLENQLSINVYSAYNITQTLLPKMKLVNKGHIINICSIAGLQAYNNGGAYSISKFAMNGFSKNLREEVKNFGIKVTTIYPGAVMTDAWGNFDNSTNRIMIAQDIAQMVYAASQLSKGACVEEIIMRPLLGDL